MNPSEKLRRQRHSRRTKSASEILKGRPMLPPPPPEFDMSLWQQRLSSKTASAPPSHRISQKPSRFDKAVQVTPVSGNGSKHLSSLQMANRKNSQALKAAQDYTLKVKLECERRLEAERKVFEERLHESKSKVSELEAELGFVKEAKQQEVVQLENRLKAMQASYDSAMKLVEELEKLARRTGHLKISTVRKPFIHTLGRTTKKEFNSIVLDMKKYPSTYTYVESPTVQP